MLDKPPSAREICHEHARDPARLLDILRAVQAAERCVSDTAIDTIADELSLSRIAVQGAATFYTFLRREPTGRIPIRLSSAVVDRMAGADEVATALSEALGIVVGETTHDGELSLELTSCIGMSDQAPAALVGDVVVTRLTPDGARRMVSELREHGDPARLVRTRGDGNNGHELIRSMVRNNVHVGGPVLLAPFSAGQAISAAMAVSPPEVIRLVKTARLRGRGGAGFPTGMKWAFAREAPGERKTIICNADEGEPGTFKDRVLLTEHPDLVFEGMTVAGYAVGADTGLVYLRAEYAYLLPYLESVLASRRGAGLLGRDVGGRRGFGFDIRIQLGAGAYICGEETALISSCEGLRGEPKTRPPYPAQSGYLGRPTVVNNVETLCCAARILERGPAWFAGHGSPTSPGTKLLSVSGDCRRPGVYELPFGIALADVLEAAGGDDACAVQVGGPSGQLVGPTDFERAIDFEDLATGGSIMVFGATRNVVDIAHQFTEFFAHESCGYCTPCRVGTKLLEQGLRRVLDGRSEEADLDRLATLANTVRLASRCGLGQTAANPVLSGLSGFRSAYEGLVGPPSTGLLPAFDIRAALAESRRITGRDSVHFGGTDGSTR